MAKRRKPKRRIKGKPKRRETLGLTRRQAIDRMGELLAAGYGTAADARLYLESDADDRLQRVYSIIAKAERTRSWKHLRGAYSQAMMIYVLAGELYEKHPEHVIMSDAAFNALSKWLLFNWGRLSKEFREWYNITAIGLRASTALGAEADALVQRMVEIHTREKGGKQKT